MSAEPLPIGRVAKWLDVPTRRIVQLIFDRQEPFVMHKCIAHVPEESLDAYRSALSQPSD